MKQNILAIIFILIATVSGASRAQGSDSYPYIVSATNEMNQIVGQSMAPDREALLRVTARACHALSLLVDDERFYQDLSRLQEQAPGSREERARLKRNLDLFASSFLQVEEHALLKAGVDEQAAKRILWSASMFRTSLDANVPPVDLLGTITKLRSEVCERANTLQRETDSAKQWAIVRRWSFRLGGVALIAVDAGAGVISAGISTPVSVGSIAIGTAVASWVD